MDSVYINNDGQVLLYQSKPFGNSAVQTVDITFDSFAADTTITTLTVAQDL